MKKPSSRLLVAGILVVAVIFQTAFLTYSPKEVISSLSAIDDNLKREALEILDTRCNSCHRKQNPFMIFTSKNMDKRANKIYEQVFVKQRMPKGNNQLSTEESDLLKNWIKSNLK